MKLLANPLFLKMVVLFFGAAFAFLMGIFMMRRMHHSLVSEQASLQKSAPSADSFPLHTYHAVIQQLKQQKHELTALQQTERRRAKASENISVAVLSNLSAGVLFFGTNGLVRQANQSAKSILGFASPVGMNAEEIFRDTQAQSAAGQRPLAESIRYALRDGTLLRQVKAEYVTPAGEHREIQVTVSRVTAADASSIGATCLIADQTQIAQILRQQDMRREMSAEMALALRNSLVTISGYAQQLAQNRDPEVARQLAADIAAESAHLDRTIGGFLAGASAATT
ncbi:MAG: hypothetical protein DMG74_03905 [Acidobacteria bacterium]|nr:MAG: hypothetical protein DMG74_03905 [Acidobacteriota bacterium]